MGSRVHQEGTRVSQSKLETRVAEERGVGSPAGAFSWLSQEPRAGTRHLQHQRRPPCSLMAESPSPGSWNLLVTRRELAFQARTVPSALHEYTVLRGEHACRRLTVALRTPCAFSSSHQVKHPQHGQ